MGRSAELHLHVPGLLGPVPGAAARALPDYPALARLLSRSRPAPASPLFEAGPMASGPLALLGAGGEPGEQFWFRVRGVHLRPDRDRLLLFAGAGLRPEPAEADQLQTAFNAHFADRGLALEGVAGEWFLRCEPPPQVELEPLSSVVGRPLDAHLPGGPDAGRWRALLNETQMLFHDQPCNQQREREGRPVINGLWAWGGGRLVRAPVQSRLAAVHSDAQETRGLARLAGLDAGPEPARLGALAPWDGTALVELEAAGAALEGQDLDAWEAALADLERDWAAPSVAALAGGGLGRLVLDAGDGRARALSPAALRRFWRRVRPLAHWLDTVEAP